MQAVVAADKLGIPVWLRGESNLLRESTHFANKIAKKFFFQWLFSKVNRFLYIGKLNHQLYNASSAGEVSFKRIEPGS
jgi:hypothetical protein